MTFLRRLDAWLFGPPCPFPDVLAAVAALLRTDAPPVTPPAPIPPERPAAQADPARPAG